MIFTQALKNAALNVPRKQSKWSFYMSDIYIEALHVKNVRLFSELNITFNQRFNFLAGPNGCGKTSVLACISHCFQTSGFEYSRYGKDSEFWVDITKREVNYRVGLSKGAMNENEYRMQAIKQWIAPPVLQGRTSLTVLDIKNQLKFSPLFIGARRNISYQQIQGVQREKPFEESLNEYLSNNIRSLYGEWQTNIKQWIINRYFMIDKEWAWQEKQNWEHFTSQLPQIAPFNSNFSYVKTGRDFEPVFSVYGKDCYLEELSAGYQAILSLIIDIFAWIEGAMEGDERIAKNAKGTVLIDEPDVHLHPEWQLTLRNGLSNLFPNLQFIVTTHSPHLLASADAREVIIMPKAYTEDIYNLVPREESFSGWGTDDILREIMGVESLDNRCRSKLVRKALFAVENKSITELKTVIDELKQICHPNDTIVTELTLQLASLQALHEGGGND
jgi:predicted ATPase